MRVCNCTRCEGESDPGWKIENFPSEHRVFVGWRKGEWEGVISLKAEAIPRPRRTYGTKRDSEKQRNVSRNQIAIDSEKKREKRSNNRVVETLKNIPNKFLLN